LKDGSYYIGVTGNLKKRVEFHNKGLQRSTRSRKPYKLIYYEEFHNKSEALIREKQIKSYKGGEAFKRLLRGA
jgi:putative endonuclease